MAVAPIIAYRKPVRSRQITTSADKVAFDLEELRRSTDLVTAPKFVKRCFVAQTAGLRKISRSSS